MNLEEASFTQTKKTPWWKWNKRTRLEKILFILLILAIIILLYTYLKLKKHDKLSYCNTAECVQSSSKILEMVNLQADPCNDFYDFACGNFEKNTILPDHKTLISSSSLVDDLVYEQMRTVLERPIKENEPRAFQLAKSIYHACMNTTDINRRSLPNFKRIIKQTGGWPVIEGNKWNEADWDWLKTTQQLMKLGMEMNMFFTLSVDVDLNNSSKKILTLNSPLTVSFEKLLRKGFNEKIVNDYLNYLVELIKAFGAKQDRALKEMTDLIKLEIEITKSTPQLEDSRDTSLMNNPMTIKDLTAKYPYIPWLSYINEMLKPIKEINDNEVVLVYTPKYLSDLGIILNKTNKRTLANYIYMKSSIPFLEYLGDNISSIRRNFTKILLGTLKQTPRTQICIMKAKNLYAATGALYVRNFFDENTKYVVSEIIANIKEQLINVLKSVDWMDEQTRKHAVEKAKLMNAFVAYPDELLDNEKLDFFYKNLSINASNYLESMMNISRFNQLNTYKELNRPIEKNDWQQHCDASVTNAFYNPNENYIDLPAGYLQGAIFDNRRPQYMNYGSVGYTIGHEFTHGFDDEGRQFDKNGNLVDWWETETESAFQKKAQCIIDQYSNISLPDINLKLNGINTQGENIADNGAVKLAYLAYKKWVQDHGEELSLPGLPYTPEQMFWISIGNLWCNVERSERKRLNVLHSYHSPGHYRVNVPLMNSEDFSRDFDCPVGSKMNPENKCKIW